VAGIIVAAVARRAHRRAGARAARVGLAMVLGGPVLYLLGESLFRLRVTGAANAQRSPSRRSSCCRRRSARWR
jgi:hypothetical protein